MGRPTYPRAAVKLTVLLEDFGQGGQAEPYEVLVTPREVEVERNNHREADTAKIKLDWLDMPIDPRAIRSVRVVVFIADTGAMDAGLSLDEDDAVFVGFVDVPEAKLEEASEEVSLDCRDFTCLFLDTIWPGTAIRVDRPLRDVVDEIIATVPGASGITRQYDLGSDWTFISKMLGKTKYAAQSGDDAWTVLVDICGRAGLIPVFELGTLRITTPGSFSQNTVGFQYGRDLVSLSWKRDMKEARSTQVEVICWDTSTRQSRSVKHPSRPIITKRKISTKGKVSEEAAPIVPWYVQGAYSLEALEFLAKSIYEDIAREQFDGHLVTREMRDQAGTPLWRLGNGDRVNVVLGNGDFASIATMSDAEAAAVVQRKLDLPPEAARALVAAQRKGERLASRFYVRKVTHRWSRDDGYELSAEFINYVAENLR